MFLHSPYQWLLRYAGGISAGSLVSVSDGNRLKGNLSHRIMQQYFEANPRPAAHDNREIAEWIDRELPELLAREGALLLEPGRQAECQRFIVQTRDALITLVEHLRAADTAQVVMELGQEGCFDGGGLQGSIDLLATRKDGSEAVVDIKWGGLRHRRAALADDDYLQLAVYARLRHEETGRLPDLSYFIVTDAHMLSLDHAFFPHAEVIPRTAETSAESYWRQVEGLWQWRRRQLDRGLVEVTVSGTEPDEVSHSAPGGIDLRDAYDTFNDFRVLTGWDPAE